MAPALTKLTKDCSIHLSSPLPSSGIADPRERTVMYTMELESQLKQKETFSQNKVWLNLSTTLPFLDTGCCSKQSPLEFPDLILSPLLQASSTVPYKTVLLSNPSSLLSLLSLNKNFKGSQLASAYPGATDMLFVPAAEHNNPSMTLQRICSSGMGPAPDGGDVPMLSSSSLPHPPLTFQNPGKVQPQNQRQGKVAPLPIQPWVSLPEQSVEEVVKSQAQWHISRQHALLGRAAKLQRRLQVLLGERAARHCSLQLDNLKRGLTPPKLCDLTREQELALGSHGHCHPLLSTSRPLSHSLPKELGEFARHAQAVLRGVQEALDSDATDSSSSDDELESKQWRTKPIKYSSLSSDRRWQEERAEVGSRWAWLQLRLAELEARIQQLGDLHQHITSIKGGVVLAASQPLTEQQIRQALYSEGSGQSHTTAGVGGEPPSDTENEPSSPMRLLRSIERQSAQLSQIVNSLMPPLHLSPSASPVTHHPCRWKGVNKRTFSSALRVDDPFIRNQSTKRRKLGARRRQQLIQADASCVCARTRPLLTYHKPRLFAIRAQSPASSQQDPEATSSSSSSSLCPTCASCDPLALCSDPSCTSGGFPSSRSRLYRPHPILSLSSDTPLSQHLQQSLSREEWAQRPLAVPAHCHRLRRSSTPLQDAPAPSLNPQPVCSRINTGPRSAVRGRQSSCGRRGGGGEVACCSTGCRHNHNHHRKLHGGGVRGVSPVRRSGPGQTTHRRAYHGKRSRPSTMMQDPQLDRAVLIEVTDEEDSLSGLEDSDEEATTPQARHTRKQPTQAPIRRRQGESVYNINNIVIPMSLAATTMVEKLQYKNIITPSWREVINQPQREGEGGEEDKEIEPLANEVFSRRHMVSEQKERLRWTSCGKRQRGRRTTRSSSRYPAGQAEGASPCEQPGRGEDGVLDWSGSQVEADGENPWEVQEPQAPWEPRLFPLDEVEEEALRREEEAIKREEEDEALKLKEEKAAVSAQSEFGYEDMMAEGSSLADGSSSQLFRSSSLSACSSTLSGATPPPAGPSSIED